jgi:hypothetical protein
LINLRSLMCEVEIISPDFSKAFGLLNGLSGPGSPERLLRVSKLPAHRGYAPRHQERASRTVPAVRTMREPLATILLPNSVARPDIEHNEEKPQHLKVQYFQYYSIHVAIEQYRYKRISRPVP